VFHSRPLPEGKIKDGTNFSCDARGHWFLNIVVEVAAPEPLAKTRLAKSVLDAGWSSFRGMLRYKATAHGAWYEEVSESFSSRVCSSCAAKTGPKGIAELGIRSWVCAECGVSHDRDINSAQNILFRSGHRTPAEGIPALF
jgi:transposase